MKTGSRPRTAVFHAVFRAVFLSTLGALATGAQAEVVGRVLLASGEAIAVRDGRDVRLDYGAQIEHADILRTGAASSLQVRFVDESLISLRENSQLGIESYRFAGKQDGNERAIFRLLKGGFRTVTGLIGQLNRQNYEVRTPTSTIGIRGTDYAVRDCVGDCGAGVKDGLYGSVLGMASGTNKVAVTNNAGESIFGKDEHFYVADANSAPQQLLQPPTWVAVKPQGKGQAAQQGGSGSGSGSETAGGGSGVQGESRPATVGEPPAPIALSTVYVVTQDSAQSQPFVGVNGLAVAGGDILFGTFLSSLAVSGSGTSEKLTSFISSVDEPGVGTFSVSGTEGSAGSDMVGAVTGINAHFGRWINGTLSFSGGGETGSVTPGNGVHWIYGYQIADPSIFAGRTGAFQFNRVAGTAFTDNVGNIATSQSFGPMWVEFLHRKGFIDSVSYNVGGVSYAFRGIELFFNPAPGTSGLGFFGTSEDYPDQGFGKCAGGACGTGSPAGIEVMGGFAGAAGDHAGVSMGTFSPAGHTSSVQLYQCPTCASSTVGAPLAALVYAYNNYEPGGPGNFAEAEVSIKQAPYMVFSGSSLTAFDSYPNVASLGGGTNTNVGLLGAINGAFGRWNGGTVTSVSQNPTAIVPFTPGSGIHWLYGDVAYPEAVFARTGLVNFGWVAGTNPTDVFGGVGAFSPTGNIAVNFTNQTAALTAQWTTPGYTWALNGFPLVLQNDGLAVRLQTPFGGPLQNHPSTSCTGSPSCMSPTPINFADVRGTFMGTTANHIGTAISTSQNGAPSTSSVQVFTCAGKPGGC